MRRCCQELTVWRVACPHLLCSLSPPFPSNQERLSSLEAPGPRGLSFDSCRVGGGSGSAQVPSARADF